ncbi:MAG: peptide ABC transporter substrate-binding protein [Chloroflexi bacterium]|nr:peptide ABC transporter substrate-binding protein [Chloroflexota bacterium]
MKSNRLFLLTSAFVILAMALAACGGPAATTEAPQPTAAPPTAVPPTAAPVATEVPTEAPPAFEGLTKAADDCSYGGEFKSIEAVDQFTVKMTLCFPDPAFPSKMAFGVFAIQDKDYLDANGGDSAKMSESPNGTGPYMVKDWVHGDHITLEANPNYWGTPPKTQTVIFRWSPEAAQRLLELQSGTVDGIDNPAPDDFATIEADSNLKLIPRPALNIFYIGLNNAIPPFDNEKVRQAVAMAIDKKRIVENYYPAGSSVAEQFAPEALLPGFSTEGDGAKWYDYDPAAAKALLAEAGFPNGFEATISYRDVVRGYLPLPGQVAQEIQAELAEIGVTLKINVMESGAYLQSVAAGEQSIFMLGWGADYPDATNFYDFHFTGASKNFGAPYEDLVAEIRTAASLSDPAERQQHYDLVNALVKQHVPMIPVANGGSGVAFKTTVEGSHTSPIGNEYFAAMGTGSDQLVWMQNAEPVQLWCADETDGETLRACLQVYDALLAFKLGGVEVVGGLADKWEANADLTEWTFHLRQGVKFHNGADLDANDVVATFVAQWDAKDPNHKGNSGVFEYFNGFFAKQLNAPPPSGN